MSSFTENMTEKQWEKFCELMLRHHYSQPYFWYVPDEDRGDHGIEFYTQDGTIFQCYYPDQNVTMAEYKKKIHKKINDDLKKLKENESHINKMLDGIVVKQWVLLTPVNKSRDLIAYCHKKKKETIAKGIKYIDNNKFMVKVETADSFPEGKLFAQNVYLKTIDIPLMDITESEKNSWKGSNSAFSDNVERKSNSIIDGDSSSFQDRAITKYLQINIFLDQLRDDHPDVYNKIEDSARAQLESMQDESILEDSIDKEFVKQIVLSNREAFKKYAHFFSDKNMQSLSFGYLSKWIAECDMDFVNE